MNLQQIESVIWVARLRSFSGAALKMNTTQPTVSARIRELESELGVVLFARDQGNVQLTPMGRKFLVYAERILVSLAEIKSNVSTQHFASGRVSLGVSETIAHTWLPELLSILKQDYPELAVDLSVNNTRQLLRGLEQDNFNVVLVGSSGVVTEYPVLELGYSILAWMAKPDTEDVSKPLTPRDLQSRRILTWEKESYFYHSIDSWLVRNVRRPVDRIHCNTTMSIGHWPLPASGSACSRLSMSNAN